MANRERGEVSIEIAGKTYTLAMTLNAMVALEDMFSTAEKAVTFDEIAGLADRGSVKHLRACFWAVLQEHHSDIQLTDVSGLVADAGGIGAFSVKLQELAKVSAPDARDLNRLGVKPGNPPQAQAAKGGTGGRSSSRPVAQA